MVTVVNQVARLVQWSLNTTLPSENERPINPLPQNLQSIAVVSPYFLGDTILASTLIQNLTRQFLPHTRISVIGSPAQLNLLETLPHVYKHLPAPETIDQRQQLLQELDCDAVFLLRYSIPWALAMKRANISYRVGFNLERFGLRPVKGWSSLLTHAIPSGQFDSPEHQVDLYRNMAVSLGLKWDDCTIPRIYPNHNDEERAQMFLKDIRGKRVILHMTAGSPGKQWPMRSWSQIVRALWENYGAEVIAVGTHIDAPQYEALAAMVKAPVHNLCGKTTLRESAALCRHSDLVLTLDTAIAHVAAAVEAPRLVVLYGPTNLEQWRPVVTRRTHLEQVAVNISCRPCVTRTCYHRSCCRFLMPERVYNHIRRAMEKDVMMDIGASSLLDGSF